MQRTQVLNAMMETQSKIKTTDATTLTPAPRLLLQRKCACGGSAGLDDKCGQCRDEKLSMQRKATDERESADVPPVVHEVLNSTGQPLDAATRAFIEPRLGHDFSKVRIHTGSRAAESAKAVGALAYTVGHEVVFGSGQYAPETAAGKRLLGHELTHVVQQSKGAVQPQSNLGIGAPGDEYEREADRAADQLMSARADSFGHMAIAQKSAPRPFASASPLPNPASLLLRKPAPPAPPQPKSQLRPCDVKTEVPKINSALASAQRSATAAVQGLQALLAIWGKAPTTTEEMTAEQALARGFNIAFDKTIWVSVLKTDPAEVQTLSERDRKATETILTNFRQIESDLPHYVNAPACQTKMTSGSPCFGCVEAEHSRCRSNALEPGATAFVPPDFIGLPSSAILFCPSFFKSGLSNDEMGDVLLHEAAHLQPFAAKDKINNVRYYGCPVMPFDEGPGLREPSEFIGIADAYRCFVTTHREVKAAFEKAAKIEQESKRVIQETLGPSTTP